MKKAIVVGGSSGIGLAISRELIERGFFVQILSRTEPTIGILPGDSYQHHFCDLQYFDENLFADLHDDPDIQLLMITAGFGRVCEFEEYTVAEIHKTLTVDLVSTVKMLRLFYDRIKSKEDFCCGVMGSIAGLVSSPMLSVYAAAKAGVCRFVESVNIELEAANLKNRILEVSPGSVKGTRFNGGENDLSLTAELAREIVDRLYARETRYIPDYEKTYKKVIEDYYADPAKYGMHSYEYKLNSGRIQSNKKVVVGYLSGTFDLFHIGHLNLLRRAKQQCDYLIVGVHDSGKWKGKETFIPFEERKEIVAACQYVDRVVDSPVEDSEAWEIYHFDRLFVGSDYQGTERFQRYEEYFKDKNVEIVYFPYTQSTSSTQVRSVICRDMEQR